MISRSFGARVPSVLLSLLIAIVAIVVIACACDPSGDSRVVGVTDGNGGDSAVPLPVGGYVPGAAVVAWKDFVYVIGGRDRDGNYRSEVWYSSVSPSGAFGAWKRAVSLPEGRAFASCAVSGDFVYVIGGESSSGARDDVLVALVNASESSSNYGDLSGFTAGWEENPTRLPVTLSRASCAVDDGRILVVGGTSGDAYLSSAYSATVRNDGLVGNWSESPFALSGPRAGAGIASASGRVWLVGGIAPGGVIRDVCSAPWTGGGIGPWKSEPSSVAPSSYAVLVPVADGIERFGGLDGDGSLCRAEKAGYSGIWAASNAESVEGYGPLSAYVGGMLAYLVALGGTDAPRCALRSLDPKALSEPNIRPPSGFVRSGTVPSARCAAGVTLRYTVGTPARPPLPVTASSAVWDNAAAPSVSADAIYRFKAYRGDAALSGETVRSYRLRQGGTLSLVSGTLVPSSTFADFAMKESYSDGTTAPVSAVWIAIPCPARKLYSLALADVATDSSRYTARVRVTLFEDDRFRGVFDRNGIEIAGRDSPDPLRVELAQATYYALVESTGGSSGGSFALRLSY